MAVVVTVVVAISRMCDRCGLVAAAVVGDVVVDAGVFGVDEVFIVAFRRGSGGGASG